ncbi:hypothetical protein vBAmePPT11V19_00011 [Alteromonas phage vB_AmeP_PT11-V19]|nr:hypothetical protein vBAmePPT11V19_00011 [Alteromonas phage vB_AmeP_PT11-V19]
MVEWVSDHIAEILAVLTFLGAILGFAWKLLGNWLKVNYVPRKEVETLIVNLQKEFSEDLKMTSESGIELSRFIQSQLKVLQAALLHRKGHNDD